MKLFAALFLFLNIFFLQNISAQLAPKKMTSAEIHDAIKKLNVVGSVLYIAAHPDDENQRFISYMANERKLQSNYLSITRGDGGQNLIGLELRESLGVLRTEELLMARSIDGGKQFFTRAIDFGFSKSPAETMRIWNKKEVLSDVVWAIRKTQPDIIVNRFSVDTSVETHGHHTSSAILSVEAFDLAGDPKAFPEQLKYVSVWQPKRVFFNTSWFFYGSQAAFDKADKTNLSTLDLGVYYPSKGKSNNEIASEARSMHRCQGFGSNTVRGSDLEYFNYLKGIGNPQKDLFDNINTTWSRLEGGENIGKEIAKLDKSFSSDNPAASVPELLKIMQQIEGIKNEYWKNIKLAEIKEIIRAACGLYFEATTNVQSTTPNQDVDINLEAINRSNAKVQINKITVTGANKDTTFTQVLNNNARFTSKFKVHIPANATYTTPYWLQKEASLGMYRVDDQELRGLPETPRNFRAIYDVSINDVPMRFESTIANKFENPARGETWRPFEIIPPVFVNLSEKVYIFNDASSKTIQFVVKAGANNVEGILKPQVPDNWTLTPKEKTFSLKLKNEETVLSFSLTAPSTASETVIKAQVLMQPQMQVMDNLKAEWMPIETKSVRTIAYDHIPTQTLLQASDAKIVKLDIQKHGTQIGYFMGAGDDMPACLEQIGYKVTPLNDASFQDADNLKKFDAIVIGIRAYNTKEKLTFFNAKLLDYVKNGGTVVVQYNTNGRDLVMQNFGPYPFKIGRGRTTEEDATMRFLKPENPVLNTPNKITQKDFDGWVQERGLYFASEWDKNYEAVLSCNDVDEKAENGGLLVAQYGKGWYVYTGFSFFREMPMGVSGAYRLFANLVSLH